MMIYRLARADERDAYVAFANYVFQRPNGEHVDFASLLPKVYAPGVDASRMHALAVDDAGTIRGLVAALPNDMRVLDQTLKTGYIGTVSVHPENRGEGHMRRLMAMTIDRLRENGCDLALLNGARQRYEYYGFVPAGVKWTFSLSGDNVRHALKDVDISQVSFERIQSGSLWEKKAEAMHSHGKVAMARSWMGFATVCSSYHGQPWAMLRDGKMAGYVVSGEDAAALVECMAEDRIALDQLLKAWYLRHNHWLTVSMPDWQREEREHLASFAEDIKVSASVQCRVLRYQPVVGAMLALKASYTRLDDGEQGFDVEGQRFTVQVRDGKAQVTPGADNPMQLDAITAEQLFLSPFAMEGVPQRVNNWFPLPLYIGMPDEF